MKTKPIDVYVVVEQPDDRLKEVRPIDIFMALNKSGFPVRSVTVLDLNTGLSAYYRSSARR